MGLDATILGMSTQDYVLQSISTLWSPLPIVCVVGVGRMPLHEHAVAAIESFQGVGLGWLINFLWFGVLLLPVLAFAAGWIWPEWFYLLLLLANAIGVLVTAYALALRRRIAATLGTRGGPATLATWHLPLVKVLIGLLVTLNLFWELSVFAGVVGRGYSQQIVNGLPNRTGAFVYSVKDLHIDAPGIRTTRLTGEAAAYGYRYDDSASC